MLERFRCLVDAVIKSAGNLAGPEGPPAGPPTGHRADKMGQDRQGPSDSPEKTPLSNLFHSIRSGLGGGSEDQAEASVAGAVGGGGGPGGGAVVVQHVSCRRRHDSNSSSNSDSEARADRGRRVKNQQQQQQQQAKSNGTAVEVRETAGDPYRGRGRQDTGHNALDRRSGELDSKAGSASYTTGSEASVISVKERHRRNGAEGETGNSETKARGRRSELPVRANNNQQRKEAGKGPGRQNTVDEERPASGCSFTSSEWGETTPTESSPGFSAPPTQDRKEEMGSTPGQSSGYMSTSRKSLEVLDNSISNNHQHNHDSPSPSKSKSSPSKLPVRRQESRDSAHKEESPAKSHSADRHALPQASPRNKSESKPVHVRRQSSGRSETLSTCSAKTASPATKMRLLDLASHRALDRDEEDSMQSWSGGSEDTMSLGMSCSGMPVSADTPVFQKMQPKRHKGSAAAAHREGEKDRYSPTLTQHRHATRGGERGGGGGGSDHSSDAGHGSPMRGQPKAGSTPQRSSLSIPSVTASHSGSNDERSVEDDDDDIDELFAKYRSHSQLGVSRSSIGDSRESLASVYSDAGEYNYGRIPVSGEITFGLEFDPKLSALRIHLKGCRDLAPVNVKRNYSDPYVKVYLLPDKTRSGKQKSKIKKHTLNPVFNETLTYTISQGELENRTLWLTVWHNDRLGRNDFLGEVTIPMDTYRFDDPTPCTYTLQPRAPDTVNEEAMQYKGDLVLSLKYVTPDNVTDGKKSKSKSKKSKAPAGALGEIHAMVKSACNLSAARSNGMSDPFVKGYLLPDRGKTSKQKTPVVKNSVNPTWNHILVFDGIDAMEIAERCLELTVWDHETLGTNQFLGGTRLNLGMGSCKGAQVEWMDGRGQECIVWQTMMENPNQWLDAKIPLRASMGKVSARK